MYRALTFPCDGATLVGTLHVADGATGVLIVTGGVQTRDGAHRGFAELGDRFAAAGYPVFRYDRRGVGDSDGVDPGFRDSAPDIAAAVRAFRESMPNLRRIVGWGLCDGAAALALHAATVGGFDGLMLANPWTLDADSAPAVPGKAAVAAHYRARLRDPAFWRKVALGSLNLRGVVHGITRLIRPEPASRMATALADGLARFDGPTLALVASRDNTGQTFLGEWRDGLFARSQARATLVTLDGADHSFSRNADAVALAEACLDWLKGRGSSGVIPSAPANLAKRRFTLGD